MSLIQLSPDLHKAVKQMKKFGFPTDGNIFILKQINSSSSLSDIESDSVRNVFEGYGYGKMKEVKEPKCTW